MKLESDLSASLQNARPHLARKQMLESTLRKHLHYSNLSFASCVENNSLTLFVVAGRVTMFSIASL